MYTCTGVCGSSYCSLCVRTWCVCAYVNDIKLPFCVADAKKSEKSIPVCHTGVVQRCGRSVFQVLHGNIQHTVVLQIAIVSMGNNLTSQVFFPVFTKGSS